MTTTDSNAASGIPSTQNSANGMPYCDSSLRVHVRNKYSGCKARLERHCGT